MNRALLALPPAALLALAALAAPGNKLPEHYTVVPLKGLSPLQIQAQINTGTTIPMWTYSLTAAKDGLAYSGTMVGRSAFARGKTTTTIPTVLVPLIVTIGSTTFDPTATDACFGGGAFTDVQLVSGSPVLQNSNYTMNGVAVGDTQYVDAFQRANFWSSVSGSPYHTMLTSPVTVAAAQTAPNGVVSTGATQGSGCGTLGVLNFTKFDNYVTKTLIPGLSSTVFPNVFPIIVMHNVVLSSASPPTFTNCCTVGYHGAFGNPVQTYAVADFDVSGSFTNLSDVSPLTHEVGEWMDDPLGTNSAPAWGNIGQVSGCQSNLEDGDPLSGSTAAMLSALMPNGVTYHMQELAFFSWFYGGPSLGAGGMYSNNQTFAGASKACPPGGTN